MKAKFRVRQDLAHWNGYEPGEEHEVDGGAVEMETINAAYQAGSLVDVEFDTEVGGVESDHDSLAKLETAMGDLGEDGRYTGPWMEGHLDQHERDKEQGGNIEVGGDT